MKNVLLLGMALCFSSFIFGQSNEQAALKKVLDKFLLAIKNNDEAVAQQLLTEDYKIYGGFMCIQNKEQRIAILKSGQIKYNLKIPLSAHNYSVYDQGASITFYGVLKSSACNPEGKVQTIEDCPVILSFVKTDGNWRISSECIGGSCLH